MRLTGDVQLRTFGEGRDVVAIHGTPQAPAELESFLRAVGGATFHVVHLPGYGCARSQASLSVDAVESGVAAALERLAVESYDVFGYSGGSFRAFHAALTGRLRPRRLLALGPLPFIPKELKEAWAGLPREPLAAETALEGAVRAMFTEPFARAHPEVVDSTVSDARTVGATRVFEELDTYCADTLDVAAALSGLRIPVSMRVGAEDLNTPKALAVQADEVLPQSELTVVQGCAHALHIEDRERTVEWVRASLGAL